MCVSVIIPTFNAAGDINRCLDSIFYQNIKDIEVIVIDDGSSDDTYELIKCHKLNCVILKNSENMGLAYSVNRAIAVSRNDIILRLDADDYLLTGALDTILNEFLTSKADLMSFGIVSGDREFKKKMSCHELYKILRYRNPIYHPTVIMNKSVLNRVGGYNEDIRRAQDFELWQRMKLNAIHMEISDSVTVYHSPSKRSIRSLISELKTNVSISIKYKSPLILPYSIMQFIRQCAKKK